MDLHVKFSSGGQREFLKTVEEISDLNVNKLAKIALTVPRNYRDWRRGKINMSLKAVEIFCLKYDIQLPEKIESMIQRWLNYKRDISRKGGVAFYKKYGNPSTSEGRKKGGATTLSVLRAKKVIPPIYPYTFPSVYSIELAEFVGIMLGDGGINKSGISISLNSIKDAQYVDYVSNLCEGIFGRKPKLRKRKYVNCIEMYLYGEKLVGYLEKLGLRTGNKVVNQVGVPNWVHSDRKYVIACLRGLMDTDGGVFTHRYKVNDKLYCYKKICFSNHSMPLLSYVSSTLRLIGLKPKEVFNVENKKVWLYNSSETGTYLRLVGSSNNRLLKYI